MNYDLSIYQLGLDKEFRTERLGCVMLETTSPVDESKIDDVFRQNAYFTDNPNYPHVAGIVPEHHITVHYGFLPEVTTQHMARVLQGWKLFDQEILGLRLPVGFVEVFPSSVPDENYECVVVRVDPSYWIMELREQMRVLPNLSTFPYKPHVTVGYFNKGFWTEYGASHWPIHNSVTVTGLKLSAAKELISA